MHDKIVFEDSNLNSNDELLKENTPETIDYNKLYNIDDSNSNINTNNINVANNVNDTDSNNNTELSIDNSVNNNSITPNEQINTNNISNTNIINDSTIPTQNNETETGQVSSTPNKKANMTSLLFVFLIFIVIMGIIIFLFPLIGKILVK